MFGYYALPNDDVAGRAATIVAGGGSPSDEDPEYPAGNLAASDTTGHLNLPSRPAKLLTTSGYWELTFDDPVTLVGAAIIYHNLDEDLDVTLEGGTGSPFSFSAPFTMPSHRDDDWTRSPWIRFAAQTHDVWRLSINEANTYPVSVGRLLLLTNIRDLGRDVRWGVLEEEEHANVNDSTDGGHDFFFDMWGARRRFEGEFGISDLQSNALVELHRRAHGRVQPWLLIPDQDVNEALHVRFEQPTWSRTRVVPDHNTFPFFARELARGLPWP